MKRIIIGILSLLILSSQIFAGVTKKTKTKVSFNGIGTYKTEQSIKLTNDKKREDSKNDFKGEGITGKLMGKFILKSKEEGKIIDLSAMKLYELDHKKKRYEVKPIEKMSYEALDKNEESSDVSDNSQSDSDIEIIKSEFKVVDTGETKKVNGFSCKKYDVFAYTQWKHKESGQKGTDSLYTSVWTTDISDELKKAQDEEKEFNKTYLNAIGLDLDDVQRDILGTNWLSFLNKAKDQDKNVEKTYANMSEEMAKIEGYPVLIDGKYYAVRPKMKGQDTDDDVDLKDVNKAIGGLAKGLFGKKSKKSEGLEPAFTYYTELKDLSLTNVDLSDFSVPSNYKEK